MRIEQATGEDCISIHALHEESDSRLTDLAGAGIEFQSTLSMRRATEGHRHGATDEYFNPRSP